MHEQTLFKKIELVCDNGIKVKDSSKSSQFKTLIQYNMSLYKELAYERDFDKVVGIQFCVMSPDQIVAQSVVEVTKPDTFDRNEPTPNGLFDPRMGVIENNKTCVTCDQKNNFCPGHFGHIVLAKPVFHVHFFNMVRTLLKCVCFRCSRLLIDTTTNDFNNIIGKKMSRQKKFEALNKLNKAKRCGQYTVDGCGAKQPVIGKEGILKIYMEWKDVAATDDTKKQILNAEDVLRIFRRISDMDSETLGFQRKTRPEHLICTVLPVPPPSVRPSVRNDTGQRSEDDLTHKLSAIVKYNNVLKVKMEKSTKEQIDMHAMLLQYEVATLIDNTIPSIPQSQQRTGRPIRSVIERLKGKEGRVRGNLMGKRVDFSARSVITPDPNISIDELGVPIKIAMNLTFPEIVNRYNIEKLHGLVLNGPNVYPGAKFLRKTVEQRTIRLKNIDRTSLVLEYGDVVERHMVDGDYVLFNRQPSLHRSSMMAHKVRVMEFNTFRLNVMVTPTFNADFDGDEMNAHLPQSLQTNEELIQLARVPTQIISPRECKPIISIVQDIVLGLYRLTKKNVRINQKQFFNLMVTNPECNGHFEDAREANGWTGHQILSTIMPKKINVKRGNNYYDDAEPNPDNFIRIENGNVLSGTFDKDIYQSRTFGIIHSIYNEYGPEETKHFFDNTQKLICNWLVLSGFSVGVSDLIVDKNTSDNFNKIISEMKTTVDSIINKIHETSNYENATSRSNFDDFEKKVNKILNLAVKKVGETLSEQIDEDNNRMINMIKSKSKGNTINVSQMIGCLGQQNVEGKRIPYGFDERTLPHYKRYDDGPESRGFVESSFIGGLNPQEFFFAAMGGREGLIDTAVQSVTADTCVVIIENNKAMRVRIGDWIDNALANSNDIRLFKMNNMEMLNIENIYIPTTDQHGCVTWAEVTALTRHDPGEKIYEIETLSGRRVIVAESKSLIVWNESTNVFEETTTSEIQIGDLLPVNCVLNISEELVATHFNDFPLNYENGCFIGLYLACGSCQLEQIVITNKDTDILKYTSSWFETNNIKCTGNEDAVIGESASMLAFLDTFVGRNGQIPDITYNSPLQFVTGLLSGYISGADAVKSNNITVAPRIHEDQKQQFIEGFAMLCSRIGVFGSIDNKSGQFFIRRHWVATFGEHVTLVSSSQNEKLRWMMYERSIHRHFKQHNDIVMDPITKINVITDFMDKYPKLYDITVPSTLNFGLANGLQVRDTSETGYIQRKLVKAMEDCKVKYDRSVRNANGSIIQFLYGDDGMDSAKIESQPIPYIRELNGDIPIIYNLKMNELQRVMDADTYAHVAETETQWRDQLDAHLEQLRADHEFIVTSLFRGKVETNIMFPVSIARTITITKGLHIGSACNLTPFYILDSIDQLCIDLIVNKNHKGNMLFQMLLRAYLTPYSMIIENKFGRDAFDYIVSQIRMKYYDSLAHPSEMVGVVAAQSIGEPATQLTLNSVEWGTELLLDFDGKLERIKIGEYIDQAIQEIKREDIENHPNDTTLGWIKEKNIKVLSCDEDGQVSWKLVEAITKHPPMNQDGTNTLIKVTTKSGREVVATKAKSFLKRENNKIVPVNGEDLKIGDYIPVSNSIPFFHDDNILSVDEIIPKIVTKEFGTFALARSELEDFKKRCTLLEDRVVIENTLKENVLYDRIVDIQDVKSDHAYVYDLTVKDTKNFNLFNGLCMRDTFHLSGVSAASKTVRGVPRLRELLSVSKNMKTPIMYIFFKDGIKNDMNKCLDMMNDIRIVRFKDIVISSKIYFDPNDNFADDVNFVKLSQDFYPTNNASPWVLRMELRKESVLQFHLTMEMIHHVLLEFYREDVLSCTFSDNNSDNLIFRIKLNNSSTANLDVLTELRALEHNIIENIIIKGTDGVERVSIDKCEPDSKIGLMNPVTLETEEYKEWMVFTEGTNLRAILANKNVDGNKTYSNNIKEIFEVLGIEAARQALYNEIHEVLESITVNHRHTSLLVDVQTNKGYLLSIDRHGINRGDIGPLAKCSFEETTEKLIKAGIFSECDKINGVSANVMLGQIVPAGTGDVHVVMDEDIIECMQAGNAMDLEPIFEEDDMDDMCEEENFGFAFTVPVAKENMATK
jgi:DNA-directed RNA polymerase beta' subunit